MWCEEEAGPFQTLPYPGSSWQPQGQPQRQDHQYLRNGTAKLLTLLHPATGQVRVKGVENCPNTVLPGWLKDTLGEIVKSLPPAENWFDAQLNRALWHRWQQDLQQCFELPMHLPPLRLLLVWDNLAGHKTPAMVEWLVSMGVMPLYTPLSGSWLNMAESVQRILKRRALEGQHPQSPQEIMDALEAVARGWNQNPTPFVWAGKRAARRARFRSRLHRCGASGASTFRTLQRHHKNALSSRK